MINLSQKEKSVLIGTILGDAHLRKSSSNSNKVRLQISHSFCKKEFVDWKREVLSRLCTTTKLPYISERISRKKITSGLHFKMDRDPTLKKQKVYSFYTQYTDQLIEYHSLFYNYNSLTKKYKKGCLQTTAFLSLLLRDPLSLAVWYLDDGRLRTDCNSCRIGTQFFSLQEVELLKQILIRNFKVDSKIEMCKYNREGKIVYKPGLVILAQPFKIFKSLIIDLVRKEVPSMVYKLERPRND